LVVDTGSLDDPSGKLWLFVVTAPGYDLDDELRKRIRDTLRREISPRHVPDEVVRVRVIPRTLSGKKCEVPVKRILSGIEAEKAISRDTLTDPSSIDEFIELASARR
jgi:acetoacetyl-CoA synthetase